MQEKVQENSHKTILKATGIFGFSQVLRILIGIVGSKFVAVFLGPVGIGVAGLLNNTIGIITAVSGFGINISGVRQVSIAYSQEDDQKFAEGLLVLKRWSIAVGLFGVLLTILFSKLLSQWTFGSSEHYIWFILLSANFIFSSQTTNKMAVLQGTRSMKAIAISSVVFSVLMTLVSIPIYYFFRMDGIIPVILLTAVLNFLVNWYYSRKITTKRVTLSLSETFEKGKGLIKLGFLLSINVIFGQICNYLIKLYFQLKASDTEVLGLYVVSSVLLVSYVGMIFSAMGADFYPRLTSIQSDNKKIKALVNDQIEIAMLLITPCILLFYFLAPLIIRILYSEEFLPVIAILKAALLAIIIKAIIWPLGYIILAKGKNRLYFIQELLGDFINVVLTILLYHLLGLKGIGLAMMINYAVYGAYVYNIVHKKFNFSIRKETLSIVLKSLLLGTLACLVVFFMEYPYAYIPLGVLTGVSLAFSYRELDKRIGIKSYLLKMKEKFRG